MIAEGQRVRHRLNDEIGVVDRRIAEGGPVRFRVTFPSGTWEVRPADVVPVYDDPFELLADPPLTNPYLVWLRREAFRLLDAYRNDPTAIGREVGTEFGGWIDILCIDADGDLVIVELKRDKTPREITAQALDYASWVASLSHEQVTSIADKYHDDTFESAFTTRFETDLPETLNGEHRILIVGSKIDAGSERIISYLSGSHGVNINAATFQYFQLPDGSELLARVFLLEPSEVELKTRTKGGSKRRPNLTYEELAALAAESGVEELYGYAVAVLGRLLHKDTTRSSIRFTRTFDGSRRVIISLLPGESSPGQLQYQLYKNRFGEMTKLSASQVEDLMPVRHEDWIYTANSGPDGEGFEGFIASRDEIDRLAEALRRIPQPA